VHCHVASPASCPRFAGEQRIGHGKARCPLGGLASSSASTPPAPGGSLTRRPGRLRAKRRRFAISSQHRPPRNILRSECGPCLGSYGDLRQSSRPISAVTWPADRRGGKQNGPRPASEWPAQGSCEPDALRSGHAGGPGD